MNITFFRMLTICVLASTLFLLNVNDIISKPSKTATTTTTTTKISCSGSGECNIRLANGTVNINGFCFFNRNNNN